MLPIYLVSFISEMEGRNSSARDLIYIGHSMGTTMAFAMLSLRPEYNNYIKAVFALAPVAFMGNVKSPIRLLAPFSKDIEVIKLLQSLSFIKKLPIRKVFNQIPLNYLDNLTPNWINELLKSVSLRFLVSLFLI